MYVGLYVGKEAGRSYSAGFASIYKPPVLMAMFTEVFPLLSEPAEKPAQERKYYFPQDHKNDDAGKDREADPEHNSDAPDNRKEADHRAKESPAGKTPIKKSRQHNKENNHSEHIVYLRLK